MNSKIEALAWLREQLSKADSGVVARSQAEVVWRSGNDKSWNAVGSKLCKIERLEIASRERRIKAKCERDVANLKTIIQLLEGGEIDL